MRSFLFILSVVLFSTNSYSQVDDWPTYGKDSGGGHYSKATEITPENVKDLKKVWSHRSGDYHEGGNWREGLGSNLQTSLGVTPILVDETLYYCTPYNRVFALDAETGEEKWVFDPNVELEGKALLHCRGVSSWKDLTKTGTEKCSHRIIAISGNLGAGKTTLIKHICSELQVDDCVSSPTFSIVNEYLSGNGEKIFHFDFYRLNSIKEAVDIGVEFYFNSGSYCFIEWPELIITLLDKEVLFLNLEIANKKRVLTIL